MTEINNIHDTFFRETMSHKEVAADFLANYLPAAVLEQIKLDTLAITKDTFVDKKPKHKGTGKLFTFANAACKTWEALSARSGA